MRLGPIFVAALLMPAQLVAQAGAPTPTPSPGSERRLSPEQIEAVLAEAAKKREAAGVRPGPEAAEPVSRPPVQGEFGISIGTGGYREVFGTGIYPMGDDGVAVISLDFVDLGNRRFRR